MITWVNGQVCPDPYAISSHDRGLLTGAGLFETIMIDTDALIALDRHLARLRRSAPWLGLTVPYDDDELIAACREVAAARADKGPERLRITLTAGPAQGVPTMIITAAPFTPRSRPATVLSSPWRRNERAATAGIKSTSYADCLIETAHATAHGADELIGCDTRDRLSEGATSNLFLVRAGVLFTPDLSTGCLPGIIRELIIAGLEVVESAELIMDDLRTADEAFLTSSLRPVQSIGAVDGIALPQGGEWATRALEVVTRTASRLPL